MRSFVTAVVVMVATAGCIEPLAPVEPAIQTCCPATRVTIAKADAFWEPMVAVDPDDAKHFVVATLETEPTSAATNDFWAVAYVTFDGGGSWTRSRLPGGPAGDPNHPLAPFTTLGDPTAILLEDNVVLFAGLAVRSRTATPALFSANGLHIFVARSTDGGLTWPDVRIIAEAQGTFTGAAGSGVTAFMLDKPWMARGADGTTLLVWSHHILLNSGVGFRGEMWAVASNDQAATWGVPKTLVEGNGFYWGAHPAIGRDGTWHVAYFQNDGAASVMLGTSKDRGVTWSHQEIAGNAPFHFPQLAIIAAGLDERLVVVYSADEGDGNSTPVATESKDGGKTWGPVLELDPKPGRTYWPQPMLAGGSDGAYYVTYDQHLENATFQRRLAMVKGGQVAESVVLDGPAPPFNGGDYTGLVALPKGAYAVWPVLAPGKGSISGAAVEWT